MFTKEQLLKVMPQQKAGFVPVDQEKEKVIKNALNTYARGCKREEIVAIYDVTILGNGKKGYLLATDGIYGYEFALFKERSSGVYKIPFDGLHRFYRMNHNEIDPGRKDTEASGFCKFEYRDRSSLIVFLSKVYGETVEPVLKAVCSLMEKEEVFFVTKYGKCLRTNKLDREDVNAVNREREIPVDMCGIRLSEGDEVVGMQARAGKNYLLVISENGVGKLTDIDEFALRDFGGRGAKCYKITEKTGNVAAMKMVDDTDEITVVKSGGGKVCLMCSEIPKLGKVASGAKLIDLCDGEKVIGIE